jgi:hypothetical protein
MVFGPCFFEEWSLVSRRIRFDPSFFWGSGKYGALVAVRPNSFVYFVVGLEIGIALIGAIVFLGLHAWQGWGQRRLTCIHWWQGFSHEPFLHRVPQDLD